VLICQGPVRCCCCGLGRINLISIMLEYLLLSTSITLTKELSERLLDVVRYRSRTNIRSSNIVYQVPRPVLTIVSKHIIAWMFFLNPVSFNKPNILNGGFAAREVPMFMISVSDR